MWLDKTITGALMTGNNIRFHNYKLTITAPDGTTTTKTWEIVQDTTSSQSYTFTPNQVGTYNFTFDFPGQTYTWNTTTTPDLAAASAAYYGDYYMPSNATCTLTVTEEATTSATGGTAMPTEYWSRPIFGENNEWYSISHLTGSATQAQPQLHQGYGSCYRDEYVGSQTAHIMWTKPIQDGGIVGGNLINSSGASFFEGTAYLGRYKNPIIVAGKLYYTEPVSFIRCSHRRQQSVLTYALVKNTGAEADVPALSHALVWDVQNPNQHGTFNPLLVARSRTPHGWHYDAYTGNFLFNATNVPTGTTEVGPNGEYLIYTLTNYGTTANPNWYLARWNSTKLWTFGNTPSIATTVDASTAARYDFNVSVTFTA